MKSKNFQSSQRRALFEAVLALQSVEECECFFDDLCTPSEVQDFSDRWEIAKLLVKEMPYRQISEETGVSTTTVSRVARFLNQGNNGYKTILERLGFMS